jgi:outer membrane protein TolC
MERIFYGFLILMTFSEGCKAQGELDKYIDSALLNNIVLSKKNIDLQQAEYALKIAGSMFYPTVDFRVDYVTSAGGRNIEFPVGDLLNDAYTTLNQLTQSQRFPTLENQSINFLPQNFHDARVHAAIPIINKKLKFNKQIKAQQVDLSAYEIDRYKRVLVSNVKTAYYAYLRSIEAIEIYKSSLVLAEEGRKMNERLLKHGKGLPAYILRADSEIENAKARLIESRLQSDNAMRYFNFLLNRDQMATIDTSGLPGNVEDLVLRTLVIPTDISGREELKSLEKTISLQEKIHKMNESFYYPTLGGFLDPGTVTPVDQPVVRCGSFQLLF